MAVVFPEELSRHGQRPALRLVEFPVVPPGAGGRRGWTDDRVGPEVGWPPRDGTATEAATSPAVSGGPARRLTSGSVRRRRALLGLVAGALVVLLALPIGAIGGRALPVAPAPLRAGSLYVVQPGDTLWSIAVRLDPSGDPRVLVAQLAAESGSDSVVVGERLRLP
jgi:hypothetical protein